MIVSWRNCSNSLNSSEFVWKKNIAAFLSKWCLKSCQKLLHVPVIHHITIKVTLTQKHTLHIVWIAMCTCCLVCNGRLSALIWSYVPNYQEACPLFMRNTVCLPTLLSIYIWYERNTLRCYIYSNTKCKQNNTRSSCKSPKGMFVEHDMRATM